MNTTTCASDVVIEEMSREDGAAMLHGMTCDRLGISGSEFLERLDAGEYDDTDSEDVIRLRMMAPFAR